MPFDFVVPKSEKDPVNIKWEIRTTRRNPETIKYSMKMTMLEELNLFSLVPHCTNFIHNISKAVNEAHRGASLYAAFPLTLDSTLTTEMYEPAKKEYESLGNNNKIINPHNFTQVMMKFIATVGTEDDQQDLVRMLMTAKKPRAVSVQAFWYRLRQLNSYVKWLPGNERALNDAQVKNSFHDAMPRAWINKLANTTTSHRDMATSELIAYFRRQETLQNQQDLENKINIRKFTTGAGNSPHRNKNRRGNSSSPEDRKRKASPSSETVAQPSRNRSGRVTDETKCPIHPKGNHVWGKCFLNAKNTNASNNNATAASDHWTPACSRKIERACSSVMPGR